MTTGQATEPRSGSPRRSLILAGGGLKVAFQAGVLQVLLDEAELEFDHVDGASGGVFNLAMYCQGKSGHEIADNWRSLSPLKGVTPNWREWPKGPYARSLFTLDGYRRRVFPDWGLDWERIRATDREATFNLYNFSANELETVTADRMDEDRFCAGVSLPMWFPPVVIDGQTYIDPVYLTDGNVEEAIRRGCDELWIIWTVSRRHRWRDGFVANYFHIIETAANGQLQHWLRRIEVSNAAIRNGDNGEFGRLIEVRLLSAEVPLNYLINFSRDRFTQAVELGVRRARQWCTAQGIPWQPSAPPDRPADPTRIRFTEHMVGRVTFGENDYRKGALSEGGAAADMALHLTIDIQGVDRFIVSPEHEASLQGEIVCQKLGGRLPVERGTFQMFVEHSDPEHLRMCYRLFFTDRAGHRLTLSGYKDVNEDSRRGIWKDTSVLYTRIVRGHVDADEESGAELVASGAVRIRPTDFLKQLTTFRVEAESLPGKATTLGRFGQFFFGKLWDVYAQDFLPWSPL
ncbi:patatin-like phospholipase family protein [Streptomyces peucetius]|uniref:Patatin-like phospholipase family protein n=1 Tax=Streptomyces peucetius TaxID=1950 RepID=A0ABY6IJA8_STRPE|nr:patatin-like phospholipase family protein [Streptomyces peucetius]UYQ65977.1 patatin-like phospholipase family protein [Streptomyces peucetius]